MTTSELGTVAGLVVQVIVSVVFPGDPDEMLEIVGPTVEEPLMASTTVMPVSFGPLPHPTPRLLCVDVYIACSVADMTDDPFKINVNPAPAVGLATLPLPIANKKSFALAVVTPVTGSPEALTQGAFESNKTLEPEVAHPSTAKIIIDESVIVLVVLTVIVSDKVLVLTAVHSLT